MNNDKSSFAMRIKELRNNSRLTQEELAKKLGLNNKSSIANYESGYSVPSDDIKLKMCEVFDCTMDYLMGESKFKTKQEELDNFIKTQNSLVILKTIERHYYDYVVPCQFKEKDIDTIVSILSNASDKENTKQKLDNFVNSFDDEEKKKKTDELIDIIIRELIDSLKEKDAYHYLISQLNNQTPASNKFFVLPILGKIAAGEPILAEQYIEGYLPVDPNVYGMSTPEEYFYLKVNGESMNLKIHNGDYALIHKQDYAEDGNIVVAIVNGDSEATLKRYKRINEEIVILEPMSTLPMEPIVINLKETPFKIIGKAIGQFGKF